MSSSTILKIKNILLISFAFFLPIHQKTSTFILIILVFFSLISIKKHNFSFNLGYLPLLATYFLYIFSLLYSSEYEFSVIEHKASFLAFPLIFMTLKIEKKVINIFRFFVVGSVVSVFICDGIALYNFFNVGYSADTTLSFYNAILQEKNVFFSFNFSKLHQPVYWGMYLSFAIGILLFKPLFNNKKSIFIFTFLCLGLAQNLNKTAYIVLFCILIIKTVTFFKTKKKRILILLFLSSLGFCVFLINPRIKNFNTNFLVKESKIHEKNFKKIPNTQPNKINTRVMLWVSALELIAQKPFFGIGAGGSHKRLNESFAVKRQWYDKDEKYHSHNQYLQILLDIGIFGFLVFFASFWVLKKEIYKTHHTSLIFLMILSINFLFEAILERYSGISFFCFFYCLIISSKKHL